MTKLAMWNGPKCGLVPAEQHLQQVARVVAEPVHLRVVGAEPAAEDVQRQWESIHFREQGHDEGGRTS